MAADGTPTLRQGVAADRRISLEDEQMRHGRTSRRRLIDGYTRHVLRDLDHGLVAAVGVTAANVPEAAVGTAIQADLAAQGRTLAEVHLDRAYLSCVLVRERPPERAIDCKAWPVHHGPHFPKTAFVVDWEHGTLRCPNQVSVPFQPGETVQFPTEACQAGPLRAPCTSGAHGRSVAIPPDERLLEELRQRQQTPAGRAKLRERVGVEHTLAHIGHWQGDRTRYWGVRKNLFDLRRCAVVHNLHVIVRLAEPAKAA
jgi:hypothetical protein